MVRVCHTLMIKHQLALEQFELVCLSHCMCCVALSDLCHALIDALSLALQAGLFDVCALTFAGLKSSYGDNVKPTPQIPNPNPDTLLHPIIITAWPLSVLTLSHILLSPQLAPNRSNPDPDTLLHPILITCWPLSVEFKCRPLRGMLRTA